MEPRGEELRFPLRTEQILKILGKPAGGAIPVPAISSISTDHRKLPADLFVAISGTSFDATQVIEEAVAAGARSVVAERRIPDGFDSRIPWWHVKDARWALAHLQQAGAGFPGESLHVYGITWTNGKSTTVQYLASILESAGRSVGWMTT
ncbi:MAG: hypothetical protein AAEJ04_04665, partial [Planctomycetota bacterium]